MKKWYVFLTVLIALLCLFSLSACDGDGGGETGANSGVSSSEQVTRDESETVRAEDESEHQTDEPEAHECLGVEWVTVTKPTCTLEGEKEFKCSCGKSLEVQVIEALGHDEVEYAMKAATCTEVGWDSYVACKRTGCGYSTYQEKAALGHDEENHAAKEATCTESGWDAYVTCKRGGCNFLPWSWQGGSGRNSWHYQKGTH